MTQHQHVEMHDGARERLAGKVSRFLFGNDAFISYARRDATIYSLELANQLTKQELSCFLDQWGTPSGKELPAVLVSTLKRSNMLILLGTEKAAGSDAVKKEIIEFKKTGRTLIPVSFDGALEKAEWYGELIAGISIAPESTEALETGKPSENVVDRIVNAENFTRRNKRLRNYFWITAASVVMMLLAGALVGFVIVSKANAQAKDAEARRADAVLLAKNAEKDRKTAEAEANRLSLVAKQAEKEQKEAEGKAEEAAKKEAEASANARKQEQLAIAQKKIADEQTKIANAQQERSRRLNYIGNMQLAQQTFEMGKIDKSEKLLSEFLSTTDGKDLRGFEWFYLWNTIHRKQVDLPLGPKATRINSFIFLPGKKQFVTADYESLKLWDATSNQMVAKVDGRFDYVSHSRDGNIIAAAREKTIKLFNAQNLAPITGVQNWPREFRAIAFSPAQNSMLVSADESEISLWQVTSDGMRPAGQTIPAKGVSALAFSPDGKHLGINSSAGLEIWDIPFAHKLRVPHGHEYSLYGAIYFLPDNQTVGFIEGNAEGLAFSLWDFKSHESVSWFELNVGVKAFASPDQDITAVISPNGEVLAVAALKGVSYGGGVKVWHIKTEKPLITFDGIGLHGEVTALAFSEDGKTLAIGSKGQVQLSNATTLTHSVEELHPLEGHYWETTFSAGGNLLVTPDSSSFYFWNSNTGQLERKLEKREFEHVFLSADGSKYVTTTPTDKEMWLVEFFDLHANLPVGRPLGVTNDHRVALSPNGSTLVLALTGERNFDCDARCLQFVDTATGTKTFGTRSKEKRKVPSNGSVPLIFSPNGRLLVFRNHLATGHSIDILDVATKRSLAIIGDFNEGDFNSFAFSPNGDTLAIGSEDSTVSIWDVSSLYKATTSRDAAEEWKPGDKHFIARLEGHAGGVRSVAFSRDGETLATGSVDGTVKLWDTRFYQPLITLKVCEKSVRSVAFSHDGRSLITDDSCGAIKFWRAASKEGVAAAR